MVEGKLRKYLSEMSLCWASLSSRTRQATVESLLKKAGAEVVPMVRFEVGDGIEKKQGDFRRAK